MERGFSPGLPKPKSRPDYYSRELTGPGSWAQGLVCRWDLTNHGPRSGRNCHLT